MMEEKNGMVRRLSAPPEGEYDVHCSKCRRRLALDLKAGINEKLCPECGAKARFHLATVRAKRGRYKRLLGASYGREYFVRYIDSSGEGFLEFDSSSLEDIELRSRDVMIVVFPFPYKKNPSGIYNCSIKKYYRIE